MTQVSVSLGEHKFEINITKQMAGDDPEIPIYHVELLSTRGSWNETWATEELLRAFLRGVEAGAAMCCGAYITQPEIPR